MDNDYTINDLSEVLCKIGKKKHGAECAHAFALGTIVGLTDFYLKHNPEGMQRAVNERYEMAMRDLACL